MIQKFNRWYPQFLSALHGIADVLMTLTQTVAVSFGVPAVLVILLYVEQQRVMHGIALFETGMMLSSLASWALVLVNLVLEFQVHYIEQTEGYHEQRQARFSLRRWGKDVLYFIGWGNGWEERYQSPALRYKRLLSLVTFTILALSLAGSMREAMEQQTGAWYQALVAILLQSNLSDMAVWLGGLLFALTAVMSAQGLSRYVAIRAAKVTAQMQSQTVTDNGGQRLATAPTEITEDVKPHIPVYTITDVTEHKHTVACADCGWEGSKTYTSADAAQRALNAHRRYCPTQNPTHFDLRTNGHKHE